MKLFSCSLHYFHVGIIFVEFVQNVILCKLRIQQKIISSAHRGSIPISIEVQLGIGSANRIGRHIYNWPSWVLTWLRSGLAYTTDLPEFWHDWGLGWHITDLPDWPSWHEFWHDWGLGWHIQLTFLSSDMTEVWAGIYNWPSRVLTWLRSGLAYTTDLPEFWHDWGLGWHIQLTFLSSDMTEVRAGIYMCDSILPALVSRSSCSHW